MNCPHDRARGSDVACLGCINVAKKTMPRTIAALQKLLERLPAEQGALWVLVVAAVEESTAAVNRDNAERVARIVACVSMPGIDRIATVGDYLRAADAPTPQTKRRNRK